MNGPPWLVLPYSTRQARFRCESEAVGVLETVPIGWLRGRAPQQERWLPLGTKPKCNATHVAQHGHDARLLNRSVAAVYGARRGVEWTTRQQLIYPELARDKSLLWKEPPYYPLWRYGRPVAYDVLDEWTRLPTEGASIVTHGGLGDAGGAAQYAGLYWEDGRGLEGAEGVDDAVSLRMSLGDMVRQLASTTATY